MIDLTPHHLGTVRRILAAHVPAGEIRAFGSRATWTAKDYSDLDLAIVGAEPLGWGVLARLQEAFEESDLPMRVDVHDWHTIPTRFREVIERDYVVLQHGADEQSAAASDWKTVGEFAPFSYGKGLPQKKRNSSGHVPVFGSNGIVGYHNTALTDGPTVIIGRKGTAGAVHYSPTPCWPIDTTFFVTDNDPGFLRFKYYALQCLGLDKMNTDSAVPGLNRSAAHARELYIPTESEQRAIAHVLGTLDDKIELNRRMNETLEAMARALFQDWFVDFGPTRAKLAGQAPYLPPELWALFPERLVESELGEIPEGWEVKQMGDVIEIHDSRRVPLNSRQRAKRQGPYPYYGAAGVMDYVDDFLFDGVYVLTGEDGSVVNTDGHPVVQYVWGKFWVNNHAHVLRGRNGFSAEHLYLLLRQANITAFVTGAVQPKLNQKNLKAIPIVLPDRSVCRAFSGLVQRLFAKVRSNTDETESLAALRDTLLPRLLSGEVRVGDGQYQAEDIV